MKKWENYIDIVINALILIAILSTAYLYKCLVIYIPILGIKQLKLFFCILFLVMIISWIINKFIQKTS